ncbi:MAG TPA: SDR family oxidoreductase [Acidimicrobiales bacterium]|nr:SDR family oxidoreductase [Acidimicrobiales bacterium]
MTAEGTAWAGRLNDTSVAVLGGSGVLGAAVVRACGREGARVAVGYRSSASVAESVVIDITAAGGAAFAQAADVTDATSLESFMAATNQRLGGIDVLVNAFGRIDAADAVRFSSTTSEAWEQLFRVDVEGTFLACRTALPYLQASRKASIVNFAGSYGNGTNQDNLVNSVSVSFCAAKGAIRGFTAALARDLAPHVRVNAVSPGMIEANWDADWNIPQQFLDEATAATPLRRLGTPDEIAETVVYLASSAGGYMTGQILQVDGGWLMPG